MSDQLSGAASSPFAEPAAFVGGRPDAIFSSRTRAGRTALQLRPELSFDAWHRLGAQIGALADASAWWIGDWLVFGQKAFPDRYRTAIATTGFSYQTLRNYAWVAGRFPLYRRRDTLSFGHHAEVASLPEEEQEQWLMRAVARRWSRNEMRAQLRREKLATPTPIAIALQVEESRHELWRAAANAQERSLVAWMTDVLDAAAATAVVPDAAANA